jgi:hypothetical protein
MTFNKQQKAKHIFKMWEASLAERDRSVASLKDNFCDLFYELNRNEIDFETAFSYLDPAIAAHLPSRATVKITFKKYVNKTAFDSEEDFLKSWKGIIRDAATNSFYSFYPVVTEESDQMPNGMSRDEYNKYLRYAKSFPILDTSKIPDIDEQIDDLSIDDLEL